MVSNGDEEFVHDMCFFYDVIPQQWNKVAQKFLMDEIKRYRPYKCCARSNRAF